MNLTKSVIRFTSKPFGPYSKQLSHSYLVGSSDKRILIDAGTGHPEFMECLSSHLNAQRCTISHILVTHSHAAHWNGAASLGSNLNVFKFEGDNATDSKGFLTSDGMKIVAYHTPGHSLDHGCFLLENESILFTGDAIFSNTEFKVGCQSIFCDLKLYLASLSKIERLMPHLIFPGHGDIILDPLTHLQNARQQQQIVKDAVLQTIAASTAITTKQVIQRLAESWKLSYDETDALSGCVRLHLLEAEEKKQIRRRQVVKDHYGNTDAVGMKGPGGLTMHQIFGKVQESRRRDVKSASAKNVNNYGHPVHSKVDLALDVSWSMN